MARLLLGLLLFSGVAFASPSLWDALSQKQHIAPISLMKKIETDYPGIISDFSVELNGNQLIYQIEVINPQNKQLTELSVNSENGSVINKKYKTIEDDDTDKLTAATQIKARNLTFSKIVQEAMENHSAQLIEAELDRDLGINYLELELLNSKGKYKLAFDVDQRKPLPLLTWD